LHLVNDDNANILGGSVNIIKKTTETLAVASKEIGLDVNADKTKYLAMSRDQNAGRSHNVKIYNIPFERTKHFKYLGTILTYQNSIPEEVKSRLKSRNACYHSVQNLLSSILLSQNIKIKVYRTIILRVCYGYETWSLTLREERKLRVLRRIFGPKRDEDMPW